MMSQLVMHYLHATAYDHFRRHKQIAQLTSVYHILGASTLNVTFRIPAAVLGPCVSVFAWSPDHVHSVQTTQATVSKCTQFKGVSSSTEGTLTPC